MLDCCCCGGGYIDFISASDVPHKPAKSAPVSEPGVLFPRGVSATSALDSLCLATRVDKDGFIAPLPKSHSIRHPRRRSSASPFERGRLFVPL